MAATGHRSRWYNVRRTPLVHFYFLKRYPGDMEVPRDFVEEAMGWKKSYAVHAGNKIVAGALIDRAYRIEAGRPALDLEALK
jgi:hypothetical protein